MEFLIIITIFLITIYITFSIKKTKKENPTSWPGSDIGTPTSSPVFSSSDEAVLDIHYKRKDPLFSPAERSFYGVMAQAISDKALIFGKVRVADILTPIKYSSKSDWQTAFNKVSRKHFDFVLCHPMTLSVLCVIELNDKSHLEADRIKRDDFLKSCCESAKLPLVQFDAKYAYSVSDLLSQLMPYINLPSDGYGRCPRCNAALVIRENKKDVKTAGKFLGCYAYPKCRHTQPLKPSIRNGTESAKSNHIDTIR